MNIVSGPRPALRLTDIVAVMKIAADASDPLVLYRATDELAQRTIGHKLFTVLKFVEATQEVERLYSSDLKAYPIGGRKQLATINKDHGAVARGEVFLAKDADAVRATFPDHALIFSLGIGAILNAPIRHGGLRLGTLNLSHEANWFGPSEIENAMIIASLLVPTLQAAMS